MKMTITTARLSLSPMTLDDLEAVHSLWTDPGVRRFLFDDQVIPIEQTESEISDSTGRFAVNGCGLWVARLRDDPTPIGFCGYRPFHDPPQLQLLYGFFPNSWCKGLATEAARAMIRFGFEKLGLDWIDASADTPNVASFRVMEKAGMSYDRRDEVNGLDTISYRLLRANFKPDDSFYEVRSSGR